MPGARGPGERLIEGALAALAKALDSTKTRWMIIGGIAVIAHGVRRMTTDIDAVLVGGTLDLRVLVEIMAKHKISPRIGAAAEFARANQVLLLRHDPTGIELDVSFAWTSFELEALERCRPARFGDVTAPMARPDDLVIFKAMAARSRDIEDASTLLMMYADIDLARVRRHLHDLATLADEPILEAGLETIIAATRQLKPARSVKPSPPRKPPRSRPPVKKQQTTTSKRARPTKPKRPSASKRKPARSKRR